ncbi:MAG: L,D-transpeptidase [Candidatus Krumholzibacteriia bacterium]
MNTPRRRIPVSGRGTDLPSYVLLAVLVIAVSGGRVGGSAKAEGKAAPDAGEATAGETWQDIMPAAFRPFQPRFPVAKQDGGPTVLALQQVLDRAGFSPGVIDGRWGKNTEKALSWLQDGLGLEPTGVIDAALYERIRRTAGTQSPVTTYRVSTADLAGPFTAIPEGYQEKAALSGLEYGSIAEALAERFHTTVDLLAKLNPAADFDQLAPGAELLVPDVVPLEIIFAGEGGAATASTQDSTTVAAIVISKSGFYLHAVDAEERVIFHAPTTVGAGYDPSPTGEVTVTEITYNPTFHYQPELFAEVPDDDATALLPAGPNSPVGVVWIALSLEHFGIHGTADPSTIGYSTSHGCVRLTNWDAQALAGLLSAGIPVVFRGDHPDDQAAGREGR